MSKSFLLILLSILFNQANGQTPSKNLKDTIVVSFISIGTGTDYKGKQRLDQFVNDFQGKHQNQPVVTIKHWGREGETDYVFDLQKLTKKDCKAFVTEVEAMFPENNLVKISRGH